MEAILRKATGAERKERRRPNSPRMLPPDRAGTSDRRAAFEAAGRPLPRRDASTGRVLSHAYAACLDARGGRVLY